MKKIILTLFMLISINSQINCQTDSEKFIDFGRKIIAAGIVYKIFNSLDQTEINNFILKNKQYKDENDERNKKMLATGLTYFIRSVLSLTCGVIAEFYLSLDSN